MRRLPRISSASIIQLPAIQQGIFTENLAIGSNYVTVPINTFGTFINLASYYVSYSGTVGSISGTGPWTATITGMTSTSGLVVSQVILAVAGTGSIGTGAVTVASIVSSTSITITATGGTTPGAGTVTNITTAGSVVSSAWTLDLAGISLSVNYALPISVLVPQGGTAYNPTVVVNGYTATLIGAGPSATINRTNQYYYTIICTAPNQYSYFVYANAI